MAHEHGGEMSVMSGEGKEKEDKSGGKIKSIHIRVLDDGTYSYSAMTDKMKSMEYSFEDMDEMVKGLKDDLGSPHLRKPKLGTGERFSALKQELARKGAKSPGGLAAYIGRKKYGKSRFQKLAEKGR